jgi:hypothetical protein
MQSVTRSRYTFKKCHFIKVDVEFSPEKSGKEAGFSPADKVSEVSRLYLEYPVYD